MGAPHVTVYCDNVNSNHVHCNKYNKIAVENVDETFVEVIERSSWSYRDGNFYCPEHKE